MKFKSIKSVLTAISIISICFALSACGAKKQEKDLLEIVKEKGKITAGVKYDSKPFGFIDTDQSLKGFDIDLLKEIAKRMLGDQNAVEFKQVTSSNRIFSLTSGGVDLVAATMTITPKRAQIIDFSSVYFVAGQAIMVSEASSIRVAKDLNEKKVAVVLGSTSERNLRTLAPKAIIQGFRTYTDAFSALKSGRADALTTDDTIITGFLYENTGFKMLEGRYTKEPYGIGFRKDENTLLFQKAVNIALDEIKSDGTLERISKKWIHESGATLKQ
jgi:putative glutamine transport system substrate-binding protein